jgi:hypothetical protein
MDGHQYATTLEVLFGADTTGPYANFRPGSKLMSLRVALSDTSVTEAVIPEPCTLAAPRPGDNDER